MAEKSHCTSHSASHTPNVVICSATGQARLIIITNNFFLSNCHYWIFCGLFSLSCSGKEQDFHMIVAKCAGNGHTLWVRPWHMLVLHKVTSWVKEEEWRNMNSIVKNCWSQYECQAGQLENHTKKEHGVVKRIHCCPLRCHVNMVQWLLHGSVFRYMDIISVLYTHWENVCIISLAHALPCIKLMTFFFLFLFWWNFQYKVRFSLMAKLMKNKKECKALQGNVSLSLCFLSV